MKAPGFRPSPTQPLCEQARTSGQRMHPKIGSKNNVPQRRDSERTLTGRLKKLFCGDSHSVPVLV